MKLTSKQFTQAYLQSCVGKTPCDIEKITQQFLKAVRAARAWKLLPSIISNIQKIADEKEGITHLVITTAHEIEKGISKKIAEKVGFKKTRITEQIKPEIIGGFIARTENKIFDASIKTQLQQLKKHLQS